MPSSPVRYRVLRGSLCSGDGFAVFLSPPGFAEALSRGEIGYLNRDVWPPQRIIHDRICTDPLDIRSDYVSAEPLVRQHVMARPDETVWAVFRANIPLNRGYAFRQDQIWRHHPEDDPARFQSARVLAIDPNGGFLGATRRLPALCPGVDDDRLAVLAPCLGVDGRFLPADYIAGTYDVRHVLDIENRWPMPSVWPQATWATLRNDPGNRMIPRLTSQFDDRDRYVESLLTAVGLDGSNPRWARYNRTLIVVSDLDAPARPSEPKRFALVATSAVTPPHAFVVALDAAQIANPVVFELVQGGSFGFGVWHRGRLHDLSQSGREVSYYRGVQGLFFGCLAVDVAQTNLRLATPAAPSPAAVPEIDEETWSVAEES